MIAGIVNANREAIVPLVVVGPDGQQLATEAIIDTGFTGFLTLPPTQIAALNLRWISRQPGVLADGSIDVFDVYVATVIWDGRRRTIAIESANTEALVGMSLLAGHSLRIDVVGAGAVTISAIP